MTVFVAADELESAQDVLHLEDEIDIHTQREHQENDADDGERDDAVAHGAQIFYQLLLLEGITVGGFSDALQLILDTLDGGDLFEHLAAQLAVAVADLCQAAFYRLEVDMHLGRRRGMMMRGHQSAYRGGDVAIEQWEQPLHHGNCGSDSVDGALQSRFGSG